MAKKAEKPNWQLSFEVSPEPTIGHDGQTHYQATAVARRGDLAYVAELELTHWSEDIAAFFEQVRAVFFEAEVNGLPQFPDMTEESAATESDDIADVPTDVESYNSPKPDNPVDETEYGEEGETDYDVTFYPAQGDAGETDPAQPSLF
jgi:hypothetical protein